MTCSRSIFISFDSSSGVRWFGMRLLLGSIGGTKKARRRKASRARKLACRLGGSSVAQPPGRHALSLHRNRDIDELPLHVEALGQLLRQRLDPERLRRVVAAGEEMDSELARQVHRGLGGLARGVGGVPVRGSGTHEPGTAAGDDCDPLDRLWAAVEYQ